MQKKKNHGIMFRSEMGGKVKSLPVVFENENERERLISFIEEKGYTGDPGTSERKALYLDNETKRYHEPSVTTMVGWCYGFRYPLSTDEFIKNYQRIVVDNDVDYYLDLIQR